MVFVLIILSCICTSTLISIHSYEPTAKKDFLLKIFILHIYIFPSTDGVKAQLAADENLCRICMDAIIDCVLLECGHMVTCTKCGKRMSECPICRQYVVRAVHVFKS